jgi:hypothetical protein
MMSLKEYSLNYPALNGADQMIEASGEKCFIREGQRYIFQNMIPSLGYRSILVSIGGNW